MGPVPRKRWKINNLIQNTKNKIYYDTKNEIYYEKDSSNDNFLRCYRLYSMETIDWLKIKIKKSP